MIGLTLRSGLSVRPLMTLLVAATACGCHASASTADADGGTETDSETETDTGAECPEPVSEDCGYAPLGVILDVGATWFEDDVRFVDLELSYGVSGAVVGLLAEVSLDEGDWAPVVIMFQLDHAALDGGPTVSIAENAEFDQQAAVDLSDSVPVYQVDPYYHLALIRDAAGDRNRLAAIPRDTTDDLTLDPLADFPLAPSEATLTGLARLGADEIAAYGERVWSSSYGEAPSWSVIEAIPSGPIVRDMISMAIEVEQHTVAVGDSGRIITADWDGWVEAYALDEDLLAVDAFAASATWETIPAFLFAAGGTGGVLVHNLWSGSDDLRTCWPVDGTITALSWVSRGDDGIALKGGTSEGVLFELGWESSGWGAGCVDSYLEDEVLALDSVWLYETALDGCEHSLILTEHALFTRVEGCVGIDGD